MPSRPRRVVHGTPLPLRRRRGEIGFINPVTEPFCSSCDRIRLTADGRLRTCLFSRREWDLRTPMRAGADDSELESLLRNAIAHKELKHRINDPGFVAGGRVVVAVAIGAATQAAPMAWRRCSGVTCVSTFREDC